MFNLVINSNNVVNSLNNSYEYKFKNGNFTVPEGSQMMITSFQIPYSWYNISARYNNNNFRLHWPSPTVSSCTVTAGGSGYTSVPTVAFTGTPPPVNSVASITVTAGGSGYTSAPTVSFSGGGGGTGATATAVLTGAAVTSIIVTNVGTGYTSAPTVAFAGGAGTGATATAVLGTNAAATVLLTPTSVASLTVGTAGSGYTTAPTVVFTGGGGTGATATPVFTATTIASIAVSAGGSGYTSAPTVVFTGGGGTLAAGTAVLTTGVVTSVTITNAGSGYTTLPTISFTGGGGSGAVATAVVTATTIASITVTNRGSGYTSVPAITFTGGAGSGAAATAVLTGTSVASVSVTGGGTGYSTSPAVSFSGGGGTGAAAISSAYTPYTVNIPDGFYTVPALSIWLQQYFIEQKLYLTDASANNIYYMSFTQNTTYYANQVITKQVAITGLTAPTGFPFPPTALRGPYIEILNNDFTKLIGLKTGNYGRDLLGNLSQLSNITPQAATVNSLIVKCSLVNNGVTNASDVVDAFAIANGKFGENLNYNNNIEKWVNLSPGNYSNFIVTIVDQNLQDINIIDPNLLINFLVK